MVRNTAAGCDVALQFMDHVKKGQSKLYNHTNANIANLYGKFLRIAGDNTSVVVAPTNGNSKSHA